MAGNNINHEFKDSPDMPNTTHKKSLLPLLFSITFLDLLGVTLAIPVIALLFLDPSQGLLGPEVSYPIRTMLLGFLIAVYPLGQFFGAPILGALSDRYGRKPILMLSLFGTIIGYALFVVGIWTHAVFLLFLGRALDGLTGGNISIVQSIISDISSKAEKMKNFGLIGMAFGIGFIIGPFLGGKLSDPSTVSWFSLSTPFVVALLICTLNLGVVWAILPETCAVRNKTKVSALTGIYNMKKAFSMPGMRRLFLVSFVLVFGFTCFTQFFQVFLIERFAFSPSQIGQLFAYVGLWIAIAQGGIARTVAVRFSADKILSFSALALALSLPLLVLPTKVAFLYLIIPFISIFQGLTAPSMTAIISNSADPKSQGEILGISQSVIAAAWALPPILAGFVVALHPTLPVLLAGGFTFMGWLLFITRPRTKQLFHEDS